MLGLSFLFPAFLLGAAAVALPVLLHLLKREAAPRQPFSAVTLLKRVPVEQTRRKRLRELLLLALRVAALLLLAAAFARPYVPGATASGMSQVTVVAVDTSMSLSAPGQTERLRARALEAIDDVPDDERVGIVAFADEARVVLGASRDRAAARAAVAALETGFGGTRFGPALARSVEIIGSRPGRIVIVSDLQRSGLDDQRELIVPETVTVGVVPVAGPAGNIAVRAARDAGGGTRVLVWHGGTSPLETTVSLLHDAAVVAKRTVELGDSETTEIDVGVPWPEGGTVQVEVDDPVGYPGDDTRFALADRPPPTRVLLVGRTGRPNDDAFYLLNALTVDDERPRFSVTGTSGDRLSSRGDGEDALVQFDAVILTSTRGLSRDGREALDGYVSAGHGLLVPIGPGVDGEVVGQMLQGARVQLGRAPVATGVRSMTVTDLRHPIFRPYATVAATLGQARFDRTVAIDAPVRSDGAADGAAAIARFSDGHDALVELTKGDGTILLFGSDLDRVWNDLPLHPAFVPFVHEVVRYLAGDGGEQTDRLVGSRPPGVPPEPGVYLDPRTRRPLALNTDPRESSLERLSSDELVEAIRTVPAPPPAAPATRSLDVERRQSWWRYGLILMLVVLAAEGVVGTRVG